MGNKISPLGIKEQYKSIKKEMGIAVAGVFESGNFIGGKVVEKFEKQIAKYLKVKYAVGVNSGTDALILSLRALGIGQGDEVITTPFTFIATAEAIANLGAKPVFADVEEKTFNIDPKLIEKLITKKTKAIIPVHIFGLSADMKGILKIAKKHKLFVVEDAAQAIGAEHNKKKIGSLGDLGAFSFFPSKNLGGCGDGGMITTNNKKLAEKVLLLRNHGSSKNDKYSHLILGTNSRLDAIQAAALSVKLKYLSAWNKGRAKIAKNYSKSLEGIGDLALPGKFGNSHVYNQYTIQTKKRDQLKKFLEEQNIPVKVYYPQPLHLQKALKYLGYKKGDFPIAESASKFVLSLPIYPELPVASQEFIIRKMKEFF